MNSIREDIQSMYEDYINDGVEEFLALEYVKSDVYEILTNDNLMNEDLSKWFGNGKTGTSSGGG